MNNRIVQILAIGAVLVLQGRAALADSDYFVAPAELKASLGEKNTVILDARNPKKYEAGHIDGAIHAWWKDLANVQGSTKEAGYGNVLPKGKLEKALGGFGIDRKTRVVVYADAVDGWGEDGRIVWILKMAGVENAKMLNGGLQAWVKKGYGVVKSVRKPTAKPFTINALDAEWTASTKWVEQNRSKIRIVDSRTRAEYDGAQLFGEARGGRIPGSVLLPQRSVYDSSGRVKPRTELQKIFVGAGLKKTDRIVVYCTAGIRSAHLTLLLRMVGFKYARNYDDSFYGWAADSRLELE